MTEATKNYFTPFLLYIPSQVELEGVVLETIKKKYNDTEGEEFIWVNKEQAHFTIEMVRNLIQELSYGTYQGKTRHVILVAIDHSSLEAQNALLKTLEEPPTKTQLWLTATQSAVLLPTIISRCQEITVDSTHTIEIPEEVVNFFEQVKTLSHRELSEFAEKYSERENAVKLIDQMIAFAHNQLSKNTTMYGLFLKILLENKKYLESNVNVRLALEHCFFGLKKIVA